MTNKSKLILVAVIAVIVIAAAYWQFDRYHASDQGITSAESSEDASEVRAALHLTPEQAAGLSLETGLVSLREISTELSLPGRLEEDPRQSFSVAPIAAAVVEKIEAVEHDKVSKDQVLARLRSDALGQAQSDYLDALARFELAQAERRRIKGLWQEKIISESRWLEVDSDFKRSAATLDQRHRVLMLAGLNEKQIALLKEHPNRLAAFNLVSPIDGVIVESKAVGGQALAAGETAFRVVDLSRLWAEMRIPVTNIGEIAVGAAASIRVRNSSEQQIEGRLTSLGAGVDQQSQTVEGRVIVDNPDGRLRPGMFAQVTLKGIAYEGLAVPASAVFRMGDKVYLFKVLGPRTFAPIEVRIGSEMAGWVPILAGIKEDDEVVISGVAELKGHWQYQGGE